MQEKLMTSERGPIDETEVVAKLHLNHDKVVKGEVPMSEKLLTEIRGDLSNLECYPMYKEYTAGMVPTIEILAGSASRASGSIQELIEKDKANGVNEKDLAEEIRMQKLLAGRADAIKRNVGAYIQTVIRFHNLKRLSHGGSRDNVEQFVKADEARRRAHDGLLKSLLVLTETAKQAEAEGLLPTGTVVEWVKGISAKQLNEQGEKVVVFSASTLANERDYIKDWAIAADFDSQLGEMLATKPTPETAE